MNNKTFLVFIFIFFLTFNSNELLADSKNENTILLNGENYIVKVDFDSFPIKLGEQFIDIKIDYTENLEIKFKGNVEIFFNTPDKNKRYKFFALKLPETESLYKATHTFKEPGDWMIEIYIDDNNISENFEFFVSVDNPAITVFKHGYLVMLLVVLFIIVAFVKLSFEAKSKK
ncbi:MAG: hypothetical protein CL723_03065 [Chloroflexi bacterium]|jgi:hypothetical protein|nr:hypothetical protein [Chloroflexota bacterium]|tara:strand:+ start:1336 stop:1854 length:519 start_codon:yes stop_codon:yes gene_type:complete